MKDKHLVGRQADKTQIYVLSLFIKNNEMQINALLGKANVPAVKHDLILVCLYAF